MAFAFFLTYQKNKKLALFHTSVNKSRYNFQHLTTQRPRVTTRQSLGVHCGKCWQWWKNSPSDFIIRQEQLAPCLVAISLARTDIDKSTSHSAIVQIKRESEGSGMLIYNILITDSIVLNWKKHKHDKKRKKKMSWNLMTKKDAVFLSNLSVVRSLMYHLVWLNIYIILHTLHKPTYRQSIFISPAYHVQKLRLF